MEEREKLVKKWRDISLWDRFRSCYQQTPATFGSYNKAYSDYILRLLDAEDFEVVEVGKYDLAFTVKERKHCFSISSYPHAYGNLKLPYTHKWFHSNVTWEVVLRVRDIQLKHREQFFADYDKEHLHL